MARYPYGVSSNIPLPPIRTKGTPRWLERHPVTAGDTLTLSPQTSDESKCPLAKSSDRPLISPTLMERREELLRAAARVYARHGYRGSTTRRIADEAGVNEVTIFRQFGSKDALIHEA